VTDMVKGEHLRPLLGFGVVCVTAALIMGTGLGAPTVTGIVAAPHVRPVPDSPTLVLGQTLEGAASSAQHAPTRSDRSSATTPAAVQRETAVLDSLSVPTGVQAAPSASASLTSVNPASSTKSVKHRKPHHKVHQVRHVTAVAKPQATTVTAVPAPVPATHPQLSPGGGHVHGHEPGHGAGHGMGHGVGHAGRHDAAASGRGPGLVATVVGHAGRHVQRGPWPWSDGVGSWHSRGHDGHHGEGGPHSGVPAPGHQHHVGHSDHGRGQHR
jgi:hypothetical protein